MLLEREFKRRTGVHVPGMLLASIVETARKRRDWVRIKDVKDGFNDLDKIG